jgi:hypothetical protein
MRTCNTCGSAENPLGRLRFKKSRVDGETYCENCAPLTHSLDDQPRSRVPEELSTLQSSRPAPSSPMRPPSAGLVVVACPDCAGGVHRPRVKPCQGCAGYGAVRIEAAMLNVYRPAPIKAPSVLTEG